MVISDNDPDIPLHGIDTILADLLRRVNGNEIGEKQLKETFLLSQAKKEQAATEPVKLDVKEIKAVDHKINSRIEALRTKFSKQDQSLNHLVNNVATERQLVRLGERVQVLTEELNKGRVRENGKMMNILFFAAMFFLITTMGAAYYANSQSEKIEVLERRASEARYRLWWMQRAYPDNYSKAMKYYKANWEEINSETDSLIQVRRAKD